VPADELAFRPQVAILFAANQQLAATNCNGLTGVRSTEDSQSGVHGQHLLEADDTRTRLIGQITALPARNEDASA